MLASGVLTYEEGQMPPLDIKEINPPSEDAESRRAYIAQLEEMKNMAVFVRSGYGPFGIRPNDEVEDTIGYLAKVIEELESDQSQPEGSDKD